VSNVDVFADFDSSEKSVNGARMPLVNPRTGQTIMAQAEDDKEPRENYLMLKGTESPDTRRALQQLQNHEQSKGSKTISNEDFELEIKQVCTALAKLTVGGEVFGKAEGAKDMAWVKIDQKNAYSLYIKSQAFRNQAMVFILNPGNFIEG